MFFVNDCFVALAMKSKEKFPEPHVIHFPKLGEPSIGYISISEMDNMIPFVPKRVFWTYHTPESVVRGRHAHHLTEQVLIAVAGRIILTTENSEGEIDTFVLDSPSKGVYVPPTHWHTMQYSHTAVQLVFASTLYDEKDYIRNHADFKEIWKKQ